MLTIRRAVETDCGLIRSLADEVFPATYREIITSSQMDYMMKWMYAPEVLRREMRTGVAWFIASSDGEPCGYVSVERQGEDLFHLQKIYVLPRFQGLGAGAFLFPLDGPAGKAVARFRCSSAFPALPVACLRERRLPAAEICWTAG